MNATNTWLALRPHDTVHVRDGRTFVGGAGGAAETTRPSPTTMAGAIGAACRAALGAPRLPAAVRGPILVRSNRAGSDWRAHFPVPRDIKAEPGRERLLRGQVGERGTCLTDLDRHMRDQELPLLHPLVHESRTEKLEPVDALLRGSDLAAYLLNTHYPLGEDSRRLFHEQHNPLMRETRVGIRLDEKKQTVTGAFYRIDHWRLDDHWAFAAECEDLPCAVEALPTSVRFGGVARMADVERPQGVTWPAAPAEFPDGKLLVYLATPAVWPDGWLPPLPAEATLMAAAVGPAESFSTAVPGEKGSFQGTSLRFTMVPAGSVYHLKFPSAAAALEWSQAHHARALGPAVQPRPNRPRLDTAGFGVVLTGVWS